MKNVQARRKQHAEDTGATAAQLQSVPHAAVECGKECGKEA
jgi:hypothetical protein